jgi:predicted RNA binding protein YcfA (HicA-like mRNA interferase family)
MTGDEFLRRLRRLARRQGLTVEIVAQRGKGSHVTLYFGGGMTVLKDRKKEIGAGLLHAMCRQLGIDRNDLY